MSFPFFLLPREGRRIRSIATAVLAGCWFLSSALAAEQPIRYRVDLREPASHLARVTMTVPEAAAATEIRFPAWNALYQIRDFVRNVQELEARCDGRAVPLIRLHVETWKIGEQACASLEIRYAVYANEEGVFSSVLNEHHAFLNLAMVLFYLPRERARDVRVKFLLPAKWKLATLAEEAVASGEFSAPDYDVLVDCPVEAGNFREYPYQQSGATYRVIVDAEPSDYNSEKLLEAVEKITATETALMRSVPFSRYTFIFHFPRQGGSGGMEHRNGTAISFPASELESRWENFEATAAHEFFHLWNVKRIRPQALEPVDYVRGNDTRDLWFSEGLTSTYQELVLVRAGFVTRRRFYERLGDEIRRLEERPARRFQSLEESGREAWLEKHSDYFRPERSISYYNKGALVGFLLDLSVRHATRNRRSLDDVMRRLNDDFAARGRFFTQSDLRAIISDLAPEWPGCEAFFYDYVSGTREVEYDKFLALAGLRLITQSVERPALGFLAVRSFDGPIRVESVEPGSAPEKAGLERGDVLLKMHGHTLTGLPEDELEGMKPGEKVKFQVRREERSLELKFALGRKTRTTYRAEEVATATPDEIRVREGWIEGKVSH